jgi:hypothetical protein
LFRSSVCDLALDNFVYGAHTTASDVLWVGVPIVSIGGNACLLIDLISLRALSTTSLGWGGGHGGRMPSRVASSLIMSLDIDGIDDGTDGRAAFVSNNLYAADVSFDSSKRLSEITIVDSVRELEDVLIR